MKKDTSYSFQSKKGMEVTFEELHIRHINLLIDIKNKELNNWFLKMAQKPTSRPIKTETNARTTQIGQKVFIIAIFKNQLFNSLFLISIKRLMCRIWSSSKVTSIPFLD